MCQSCHCHVETVSHALVECNRARKIWRYSNLAEELRGVHRCDIVWMLQFWPRQHAKVEGAEVAALLWAIWKARNKWRFEGKKENPLRVVANAEAIILRIQPNLKKLYLLIRAGDDKSAKQRMFRDVIEKDLFRVLRDTWGDSLDSFILEKVVAVPGDISYEDLGIKNSNLKEEMYRQIDLVINVAAITKFDERYDALLDTNIMGAFQLRRAMRESGMELDSFNFDPKSIDWEDYFLNVRIPGLLIYVVK
ncbi:hypothetical protein CUMW_269820 [Citrus unshiu]|uniref:Fatty acyl-CoA reductase n=1 Tax=Citrus unshiu TaxID=55188 RepID=A0A2H5QX25_CITUN|nr:hypothetical protein CUMW_269820 [Citrus unshiu]